MGSILHPTPIEQLPLSTDGCVSSTMDYINVTSPVTLASSSTTALVPDGFVLTFSITNIIILYYAGPTLNVS